MPLSFGGHRSPRAALSSFLPVINLRLSNMSVISTRYALLLTFLDLNTYYRRTYCWPTRTKITELLFKRLGRWYSKSWIDDILGDLKRNKYIVSYRNYGRRTDGTVYAKASNRQLTRKALATFTKAGVKVARYLWHTSKQVLTPPDPPTATREKVPEIPDKLPPQPGKSKFLDPALRKRMRLPDKPPFDPQKS